MPAFNFCQILEYARNGGIFLRFGNLLIQKSGIHFCLDAGYIFFSDLVVHYSYGLIVLFITGFRALVVTRTFKAGAGNTASDFSMPDFSTGRAGLLSKKHRAFHLKPGAGSTRSYIRRGLVSKDRSCPWPQKNIFFFQF